MGNRGRFGKYGDIKRIDRLRRPGIGSSPQSGSEITPFKRKPHLKKTVYEKAPVEIYPTMASDIDFIGRLSGKVFNVYGPYEGIVSRWFESGMAVTLIAIMDMKPVGFAMIGQLAPEQNPEHCSELLAIAVDPERHRSGIGEKLIREIGEKAIELNVKKLFLHTATENLSAQKLFTKDGYRPWGVEKNFYPAGQDALVMSKEINIPNETKMPIKS